MSLETIQADTQVVSCGTPVLELALDVYVALPTQVNEDPGMDPYNTSGRFDRYHNWVRVSRR